MKEIKQFKSLTDLKEIISKLENYRARSIQIGKDSIFYDERKNGKYQTVMGVRVCDYKFSMDKKMVLPHSQMGLSFSGSWDNLKFAHGMVSRKKKSVDVYWMLSEADIPPELKFVEDESNPGHYFLTVTKAMRIEVLVERLRMVSYRLSVIKGGSKVL